MCLQSALRSCLRPLPCRAARADQGRRPAGRLPSLRPAQCGDRSVSQLPPPDAAFVQVRDLKRVFDVSKPWLNRVIESAPKQYLKAVDGVSFDIRKGETFALVGESGSGKSTVARMVVGLLPPSGGTVSIDGVSMTDAAAAQERQRLRRRIQMIFQDPYASLNPRWRVARIIAEPIRPFAIIQRDREIE